MTNEMDEVQRGRADPQVHLATMSDDARRGGESGRSSVLRHLLTVAKVMHLPRHGLVLSPALVDPTTLVTWGMLAEPDRDLPAARWWDNYPHLPVGRPDWVELRFPDRSALRVPCCFVRVKGMSVSPGAQDVQDTQGTADAPTVVCCCLPTLPARAVSPGTEVWYVAPDTYR